jgi:hypothetical protein
MKEYFYSRPMHKHEYTGPDIEVFQSEGSWFWQSRLPDGLVFGPFDSKDEALMHAQEDDPD